MKKRKRNVKKGKQPRSKVNNLQVQQSAEESDSSTESNPNSSKGSQEGFENMTLQDLEMDESNTLQQELENS